MKVRRVSLVLLLTAVVFGLNSLPADAQSDTTPPQLVSVSVNPTQVDVSGSSQTITVTAVINDDLSGVSTDSNVEVDSPSGDQYTYGFFNLDSGDMYSATMTIPRYAEPGIWRDWYFELVDNASNSTVIDEYELQQQGINIAIGVQEFSSSYQRSVSLKLGRTRASGYVTATTASACFWFVPVTLQRRTSSGWQNRGTQLSSFGGHYSFPIRKAGKYRAIAGEFAVGTPIVTTCLKASVQASSS